MKEKENNKQITQYKNDVNTIPMRAWTADEMDFFFAVLTRMRDEENNNVIMHRDELESLANYSRYYNEFKPAVSSLAKKIKNLYYIEETSNSYLQMPLFTYFELDWNDDLSDMNLEIEVNSRFEYILNKWDEGNWTKFMLDEFTGINSTYSKTLFRLLKQWRIKGIRKFSVEEFRNLMCVPESYSTGDMNRRIVKKSVEDLKPYFKDLKVKIVKANTKGTPTTGYIFTWKPEETSEYVENKYNQVDAEDYVESKKPNSKQNKKSTNGKKRKKLKNERNYTPEERRKMINKKLKMSKE